MKQCNRDILAGHLNRMQNLNISEYLTDYKPTDRIKQMIPEKWVLNNLVTMVMVYIMEYTLGEDRKCTLPMIAYFLEAEDRKWAHLLAAFLGVVVAIVVSHFFIHDMKEWFSEMSRVFVSTFTEESQSNHDAGSLVSVMLITVGQALLVLVPAVVLFTLMYKRVHVSDKLQWIIVLLLCAILLVVKQIYELRGILFMIPVALVLAKVLAQPETRLKDFLHSKEAFLVLILMALPFAGVFGTNQPILIKAVIFAPFWLLAFFCLSALLKTPNFLRVQKPY